MSDPGVVAALAVVMWVSGHRVHIWERPDVTVLFPVAVLAMMCFSVAVPGRRFVARPMAPGRVVAVIPAFNEDPRALHDTVRSLLAGTVTPDEIHVIDDGSDTPLPPFNHERVVWHRQDNGGKRKAQAHALEQVRDADFILTIDSDCTIDRYAVQRLLQAMSAERVQAATGVPLTRNRHGWLTKVIDLEIVSICLTYRAARSRLGSLTTCSGALALYRAPVVLDNLDDYTSSKHAHGDDRRLTHYAMLRGQVVSVAEAITHTDMPTRIRTLYRQRRRWSSSHWRYTFWEVANLPAGPMLWTCFQFILSVVVPVSLFWTLFVSPLLGHGVMWQFLGYWAVVCWLMNLKYAFGRPQMPWHERWLVWLLGTPILIALHIAVLRPAMLHALLKLRSGGWGTRATKTLTSGRNKTREQGRYRGTRIPILADAGAASSHAGTTISCPAPAGV